MSKPKTVKSFEISKRVVWEAYEKVKANQGAAGVDGESIAEFEGDLKGNLYKLWNRMSSGTYFPPPVRAVEIPKAGGKGVRVLGVPTVSDRIAQTVVRSYLEPEVEPMFHPDSYGYRPGRSALDAVGTCRQRCWRKDWVIDLDIRAFFDSMPVGPRAQGGVEAHGPAVGPPLRGAMAQSAASAGGRHLGATRSGNPAGLGDLAAVGEPLPPLRVRQVADPGVPDRQLRALRG